LQAPGELAALINAALKNPVPAMTPVAAAVANCTRGNLSAVFLGGAGTIQKVYFVAPSASPNATAAAILDLNVAPPLFVSLSLLGACCACCGALGILRLRRRRKELVVVYHPGDPGGPPAAFAAALEAAAGEEGSPLEDWGVWTATAEGPGAGDAKERAKRLAEADAVVLVWGPAPGLAGAPSRLTFYGLPNGKGEVGGASAAALGESRSLALEAAARGGEGAPQPLTSVWVPGKEFAAWETQDAFDVHYSAHDRHASFGAWAVACVAPSLPPPDAPRGASFLVDLSPRTLAVVYHPPEGAAPRFAAALVAAGDAKAGRLRGWHVWAAPAEEGAAGALASSGARARAAALAGADAVLLVHGAPPAPSEGGGAAPPPQLSLYRLPDFEGERGGVSGAALARACLSAAVPAAAGEGAHPLPPTSSTLAPPTPFEAWAVAAVAPSLPGPSEPVRAGASLLVDLSVRTLAVIFHASAPEGSAHRFAGALAAAGAANLGPLAGWRVWAAPAEGPGAPSPSDVAAADCVLLVWGPYPDELAVPSLAERLSLYALPAGCAMWSSAGGGAGVDAARAAVAGPGAGAAPPPPLLTALMRAPAGRDALLAWVAGCVGPHLPPPGAPRERVQLLADLGGARRRTLAVVYHPLAPEGAAARAARALAREAAPGGALAGWQARATPLAALSGASGDAGAGDGAWPSAASYARAGAGDGAGAEPYNHALAAEAAWVGAADVVLHVLGGDDGGGGDGEGGRGDGGALEVHVLGAGARGVREASQLQGALDGRGGGLGAAPLLSRRRKAGAGGGAGGLDVWAGALLAAILPPKGRACMLADLRLSAPDARALPLQPPPPPPPSPPRPAKLALRAPAPAPATKPQWRMVQWKPHNREPGSFPAPPPCNNPPAQAPSPCTSFLPPPLHPFSKQAAFRARWRTWWRSPRVAAPKRRRPRRGSPRGATWRRPFPLRRRARSSTPTPRRRWLRRWARQRGAAPRAAQRDTVAAAEAVAPAAPLAEAARPRPPPLAPPAPL
jgi:hypothetical protein